MNFRMVIRLLGIVSNFLGLAMAFSIPWSWELTGGKWQFEQRGVSGLLYSMFICFAVGLFFLFIGRKAKIQLFRKEALAVVALSWILATVLGALPYVLSKTERAEGVPMNYFDAMFESQSGFSTTGATVLSDVENRERVPRCIIFWRGSTHFLGGLGIMVLLVAILGQGSVAKSVVRVERAGSPGDGGSPQARIQHLAWMLFFIYLGLNAILTVLLLLEGVPLFDAICHAFATLATGGFSSYNASAGHFVTDPKLNGALIEWTLILFMFLGGCNFMLFYWCLRGNPLRLFTDVEWRTYLTVVLLATAVIAATGYMNHDFNLYGTSDQPVVIHRDYQENAPPSGMEAAPLSYAVRTSCFQVVSLITTTGFCTDEFEKWNSTACYILLIVMLTGACSGSTAGGLKLIRCVLCFKIFSNEVERSYRPNVVRNIWLQKEPVDRDVLVNVAVFALLYLVVIGFGTLLITTFEPNIVWNNVAGSQGSKLVDSFSAVVTTISNVGPGFGVFGARQNFGVLSSFSKFIFTWIMMFGRLEIFAVLVLFSPSFWKSH